MAVTVVKQVTAEVKAKTEQFDAAMAGVAQKAGQTKRQVEGTAGAAVNLGQRYGQAATQIASATETMARAGKVTGETGKQILNAGSQIAFAFGPTGAIVGALSIFGLAIATAMGNARKEVQQLADSFDQELRVLEGGRDYRGAGALLTRVLVGDPRAARRELQIPFQEFERQVIELRQKVARDSLVPAGEQVGLGVTADRSRLKDLEVILEERRRQITAAQRDFDLAAQREQERLVNERASVEEEKALSEARTEVERARTTALREETRAREELQREALDFGRDFNQLILQELGSNADQIAATFDALIGRGVKAEGENSPRVQQLRALKTRAVEATIALEAAQVTLRDLDLAVAAGGQPTAETFQQLTARAAELTAQLGRLKPQSQAYLAVQQKLLEVERKRAELLKDVGSAGAGGTGGPEAARSAADLAREIQQAVDGALQLAAAFGAVDASVIGVLRSISQVAGNIPALQTALAAGSGLGVLSAGLPIAGALASLVGDSPAEQRRAQEIRSNTEALRELTKRASLLGTNITGDAASVLPALRDFVSRSGGGQIIAGGRTYNSSNQATIAADRLGILPELQRIAAQYGITLNRNITSFEQLLEAIEKTITKLGEFGTDLESALQQADAEAAIFGITDPLAKLGLKTGALAGRSSAFDGLTAGLDLNTAEGREQARKNAQALFDILKAGGATLTAEQLGGLTGQQLLDAILALVGGLNDIDESQGTNTSTATQADQVVTADRTQITADQASRLLGLASAQLGELRLIRAALEASVNPIPLPSSSVFGSAAATAGTLIQSITIEINNLGAVTGADLGAQVSDALVDALNRAFGTRVVIARQNAGKAVLS